MKRMTMAQARRAWAKVLRSAERGTPVEVTRNGHPVAVVVSVADYRPTDAKAPKTLSDVLAQFRASVNPRDLEGEDPWKNIRDRATGREVQLD
jgi:prevent-host-death family protein